MFLAGTFPSAWKSAIVLPIPKTGDPRNYKDLRPISILSCISKIAEKLMAKQLRNYIDKHNLLPKEQSGFRPGFSCTTALLNITDDIIRAVDNNQMTVLVLLDFSKAFDTVNHDLLVAVLKSMGLKDNSIQLLQSYLNNRTQKVKIQNNNSECRILNQGVPQGSILGPLLFSLYTSSFSKCLTHSKIHMYADDTQIYISFSKADYELALKCLNEDLDTLCLTSSQHNLLLNPLKSSVLLFGNKSDIKTYSPLLKVNINDKQITVTNKAKNLGVILDSSLRYRDQIIKYIQSAYAALRLLCPHIHCLNIETKKMLCESLVLSKFNYCSPLYRPSLDADFSKRIQRVQNSCLRFVYGMRKYQHISHKLFDIKWLNMTNRRKLHALCLYQTIISTQRPPYLYNKITYRSDVHNINIRNRGAISPPHHRTVFYERSFTFDVYKLYNSIPDDIKLYPKYKFKKCLKCILFSGQA